MKDIYLLERSLFESGFTEALGSLDEIANIQLSHESLWAILVALDYYRSVLENVELMEGCPSVAYVAGIRHTILESLGIDLESGLSGSGPSSSSPEPSS